MVSETTVIIGKIVCNMYTEYGRLGTSNWSGDYFVGGTTGAAVVLKQQGPRKAMINQMKVSILEIHFLNKISGYFPTRLG
jgi:hypothetical protein